MLKFLEILDLFKNPNKLPLNNLVVTVEMLKKKDTTNKNIVLEKEKLDEVDQGKLFSVQAKTVPALDPFWISSNEKPYYHYQEYYPAFTIEQNNGFIEKNALFLDSLDDLLDCSYQSFWCQLLFVPEVPEIIAHFVTNPVYWYNLKYLDDTARNVYIIVKDKVFAVLQRMLKFRQSETEYMSADTVRNYLVARHLLNTPIAMSLSLLYGQTNVDFTRKVVDLYYSSSYRKKYTDELEVVFKQILLSLEMIGGQICGFESDTEIVHICVRKKPREFDPFWIEEVVSYLLDQFALLHSFMPLLNEAMDLAFERGLPYRISYFYERVYPELYRMLINKPKLELDWSRLEERMYENLALSRSEAVDVFHEFIRSFIESIENLQGIPEEQEKFAEKYLKLMTSTFEDEHFISDYNHIYPINVQLEMITCFYPEVDHTRTDYLRDCLQKISSRRGDEINVFEQPLYQKEEGPKISMLYKGPTNGYFVSGEEHEAGPSTSSESFVRTDNSDEILREKVRCVQEALPHLGDGFIMQCLEHYNNNETELISAILDENLPPHLQGIPFDTIYIPPEPEPEQPILAYKGKRPGYRDTNELLNDKTGLKDIKDLVINASVEDDIYDDEYDDRNESDEDLPVLEKPPEIENLNFNRKLKIRDPSSSEEESENAPRLFPGGKLPFCEDPAVVRERREAQWRARGRGKSRDVVGKPRGQGQEKTVQHNRDHKNTHKSSRANHNRKSGAQWKASRGMF